MGLCFSFQQKKDIERIASLLSSDALSYGSVSDLDDEYQEEDLAALSDEALQRDSPTECSDEDKPPTTFESKHVQVDWAVDPAAPQLVTTPPAFGPSPVSPIVSELQAQEERRKRREERRAARHQQQMEEKFKLEMTLKQPADYLHDRCKLDVQVFKSFSEKKKCLVLDIDYTIFDHKSDFDLAPEFRRPYLHEFLKMCNEHYNIVIWSATAFYHIQTKLEKLQLLSHPDFQICIALSKDHMIPFPFSLKRKTYVQDIKPLSLLWMKFPGIFNPSNTIHIDDIPENFALNPQNGLRIDPFREALEFRQTDRELFYLTQYLSMIAGLPSFELLDHCRWKDYVIDTLWQVQTAFSLPTFYPPGPASPTLLEHHQNVLFLKQSMKEKAREREREDRERQREEREKWLECERERLRKEHAGLRLDMGGEGVVVEKDGADVVARGISGEREEAWNQLDILQRELVIGYMAARGGVAEVREGEVREEEAREIIIEEQQHEQHKKNELEHREREGEETGGKANAEECAEEREGQEERRREREERERKEEGERERKEEEERERKEEEERERKRKEKKGRKKEMYRDDLLPREAHHLSEMNAQEVF